jgi:uncharacterized protein
MLTSLIVRTVRFSMRHAYLVIAAWLLLAIASGFYVARHFAINTDIGALIDRQRVPAALGRDPRRRRGARG